MYIYTKSNNKSISSFCVRILLQLAVGRTDLNHPCLLSMVPPGDWQHSKLKCILAGMVFDYCEMRLGVIATSVAADIAGRS